MPDVTLPLMAAWVNAAILGAAGLLTWFDNSRIVELYTRWKIPARFYRYVALAAIVAAAFLAVPHLRAWGIVLAAPIIVGSAAMLAYHRHYIYATVFTVMLAALGVATFAIPTYEYIHYAVQSHV